MTTSAYYLTLASLTVVVSVLPARQAAAQETQRPPNVAQPAAGDSLPFRAGQWGAEFAINNGTVGLGVLRFRSARKAWLLDASVGASWSDAESSSIGDQTVTSLSVRLRTGPRRYRPLATGTGSYLGMGVTGSYGWTSSDDTRVFWDAGVFGELGAVYFVTRRLSLGAQVELHAAFSEAFQRSSTPAFGYRDRRVIIGVRPVRIVGALYF